tara:strand:+ start:571 stop:1020 length:450 start_codon:yes stop_codon:yes gene_type:complete
LHLVVTRLIKVEVELVGVVGAELVVSGLVSTTRLKEDLEDILGGEGLLVHDLDVHAEAIKEAEDILLLDGDASLLHDANALTNPGESDELVALGDGASSVINSLHEEGAPENLVVVEGVTETLETIITSGLNLEGLSRTIKLIHNPEKS